MLRKISIMCMMPVAFLQAISTRDCLLDMCMNQHIQYVEYCFTDFLGDRKAIIRPVEFLEQDLDNGIKFDGSSVPGCRRITNSDMVLMPDSTTPVRTIPWTFDHTAMARVMCSMHYSKEVPFDADPRVILKRELEALAQLGYELIIGPEIEFYVFDAQEKNSLKSVDTKTYADACDTISLENNLITIVHVLNQLGLHVEKIHHEVGCGQYEISLACDNALHIADAVVTAKHALTTLFDNYHKKVTFMPKPLTGKPGTGMHLNFSLFDTQNLCNAFYDPSNEYGLSKVAQSFIAGVLKHAAELTLILNPTVNSYKRLGGHEAPKFICCGHCNRSALIRLPSFDDNADVVRAEIRSPDAMCNPYLAFAALLKAGMEGMKNNYEMPEVITRNLYSVDEQFVRAKDIFLLPQTMQEALDAFEQSDLMQELFGPSLFSAFLEYKKKELESFMHSVTDWELEHYC